MYKPTDHIASGSGYRGTNEEHQNGDMDDERYTKRDEINGTYQTNRVNSFYENQDMRCNLQRPNVSYAELITLAIESSPDQMMTLKEIYHWISCSYPYFEIKKVGWQNSIRHNLSLNRCFFKVPRQEGTRGKGSFWKINYEFQNVKVNYRTRKYTYVPAQQSIHSLTQILNDNNLLGDTMGHDPSKMNSNTNTTIFNGNLRTEEEMFEAKPENYEGSEDNKLDRIFSFK